MSLAAAGVSIRRLSPAEAAGVWAALVRGAWSIVDRLDDDTGRRFLLAIQADSAASRPWSRLSKRERAVVAGVADGKTNRAIASELGIAISTVAGHLRAARRKLDGARRIDLVREWTAARRADDGGSTRDASTDAPP